MNVTMRSLAWQWDRTAGVLWARVTLADGRKFGIGLPLGHVVTTFDGACLAEGLDEPPQVGECATVSGLFGRIKRLAKKAKKATRRAVSRTTRSLRRRVGRTAMRWGRYGGRLALKAARSKRLGAALGVAAVAFPAVGGPALGAWAAANQATKRYDQGRQALKAIRRGSRNPRVLRAARNAQRIARSTRYLAARNDPRSRMLRSALSSLR